MPPPPKGFTLDSSSAIPPPPPGFKIEQDVYSTPGRKPGADEATKAYLDSGGKTEATIGGIVQNFLSSFGLPEAYAAAQAKSKQIKERPIVETLKTTARDALMAGLPIAQVPGVLAKHWDQLKKSGSDLVEGYPLQAAGHLAAASLPVAGPIMAEGAEQVQGGDPNGWGRFAGGATMALSPFIKEGVETAAPLAKAGVKGAYKEAVAPTQVPAVRIPGVGRIQVDKQIPTILADAVEGSAVGAAAGALPVISVPAGAATGAAIGAGRTLARGAKKGIREFRQERMDAARGPRPAPQWTGIPNQEAQAAPPIEIPKVQLPSGRTPGGIQNQKNSTADVPTVKPTANGVEVVEPKTHVPVSQPSVDWRNPTSAGELSTAIRKGVFPEGSRWDGSKVVLPATERAAYEAMKQSIVDDSKVILQEDGMPLMKVGTEPPGESFEALLGNVRARLEAEGIVPKGYKWGRGDAGATIQNRFEEGSGGPIIDSSKSRFNGPVANPMRLKPGQPEQVIAKIEALAEPTEPQLRLVEQMKKEISRRAGVRTKAPEVTQEPGSTQPVPSAALMKKIMEDPKLAKAALDFAEMFK